MYSQTTTTTKTYIEKFLAVIIHKEAPVAISWWKDKQNTVHNYSGILFDNKMR